MLTHVAPERRHLILDRVTIYECAYLPAPHDPTILDRPLWNAYDGAMPIRRRGTGNWWAKAAPLIGVVALAVLSTSCGRTAGPERTANSTQEPKQSGSPAAQPVLIVMNEFSFTVGSSPPPPGFPPVIATLPAGGSVLVTLRNEGHIVHEWRVGRTVLPGGGYEDDLLATMRPEVLSGTGYRLVDAPDGLKIEVDSGAAVTLRLGVPTEASGTWEMGCFVPGHYQAGMNATLRID